MVNFKVFRIVEYLMSYLPFVLMVALFLSNVLKGTYQGFSFFIANSFYMSDLMYLLRTHIIFHNVQ